jgi:hypothetical protein
MTAAEAQGSAFGGQPDAVTIADALAWGAERRKADDRIAADPAKPFFCPGRL